MKKVEEPIVQKAEEASDEKLKATAFDIDMEIKRLQGLHNQIITELIKREQLKSKS